MPPTISYKRGEVVLVPFPFTDLTSVKQRPALVISSDILNRQRADVLVAAISSQMPVRLADDEISVPSDELTMGIAKTVCAQTDKAVRNPSRIDSKIPWSMHLKPRWK